MNRLRLIIAVMFLLLTITGGTYAKSDKVPIRNQPSFPSDQILTQDPNTVPVRFQAQCNLTGGNRATDQHIGEVDTVGTTWYDLQHIGTCGRMICVDALGNIHVCWTNGLEPGAASRHVYYNLRQLGLGWTWESGFPVESLYRAGFCSMVLDTSGYPIIVLHGNRVEGDPLRIYLSIDRSPPSGVFATLELPPPPPGVEDMVWPKVAVDRQNRIHVIAHEDHVAVGDSFRIFYTRDGLDEWREVDRTMTHAADISASRNSNRVALIFANIRTTSTGESNSYNNDIALVTSEDGVTWDFEDPFNVTNFICPDTLTQDPGDTLRAYTDGSILFDCQDNIHVAFTTLYYNEIEGFASGNNSLIWHWCGATGYYSLVADGWFEPVPYECGICQRFVQRPCFAEDESTGYLFVTYQQFDTSDVAENGYPQAETYISRSTNGGTHWSVGTNVTNTHAPSGAAGSCMHERDITCNQAVLNDTLCLFYILDKDAGSAPFGPFGEGAWTQNPAICQRVPIDEIPATPLMPRYPLHVDSTGFPPESPVIDLSRCDAIPENFRLYQNYPNPFNATTTITFDLNRPDHVTLKIYNILGREVATVVDANLAPGTYQTRFDAEHLASGVYFCALRSSTRTITRKMLLLK